MRRTAPEVDDDYELGSCGLGSWRPQWLQFFGKPLFFLINFSIVGIIQAMTGTYFIGSMSTLEKRFAFDSKISGFILIADNFSQMLASPLVGFLGSRFNRPKIIGIGELLLSLSCLIAAMPFFIYGPATHLLGDNSLLSEGLQKNETKYELCPAKESDIDCSDGNHSTVWPAVIMLWVGSCFRGLGLTCYYIIGVPYLDDNVSKKNSPVYMSLVFSLRLIGPAAGLLLSSFSMNIYENPFYDPGIDKRDPRFIGAWWLGFLVIGVLLFFASLPLFLFPQQLKGATVKTEEIRNNLKGVSGTIKGLKRLVTNPILMSQQVGLVFRYIGLGGYFQLKTKYIESQYRQSSSGANLLTGATSILPLAIGIVIGGGAIALFKPKPRNVFAFIFLVNLVSNFGIISAWFLGCPPMQMSNDLASNRQFSLRTGCNDRCECTTSVFTPICGSDKKTTYFSPCYAGCTTLNSTSNTFSDCSCFGGPATTGYCQSDADNCPRRNLVAYLLVLTLGDIIQSIAITPNFLTTFRSVDPADKSFAMGVMGTFMAIFAFIPYPIIFGAIADSTCKVWEFTCGKKGNCWIYDQDQFRDYLHGSALAFIMIASVFDFAIIFMAKLLKQNFYDDPEPKEEHQDQLECDENIIHSTPIRDN